MNATLKDIARSMGVSATTVHRALHGKEGVGDYTREEIQRVAAAMGYRSNYMAAALKRKKLKLAIAFPEPGGDNRYYYASLWLGARKFLKTVEEFNIVAREFAYPLTEEGNGVILKEIYENHADALSGLITVAVENEQSAHFMEKLSKKNIPVAVVGADLYKESRLCCVKTYDEMAGGLAAELLTAFHPKNHRQKMIVTGNLIGRLAMPDQYYNARGFERYIEENAPGVTIFQAYNSDVAVAYEQIKALLLQYPDINAIYSCSARHTIQMCRAVTDAGMRDTIKLVGNDCFPESIELLKKGVLTAIIDKKIVRQSYLAMQALFDFTVKGEHADATLYVRPSIVMKGNAEMEQTIQ